MRALAGLLALFLIFYFGQSCTGNTGRETVVVFKSRTTNVPYKGEDGITTVRQPGSFSYPAFVSRVLDNNQEFLAIICGAGFYDSSKYFRDGVVKISYGDHNIWSDAEIFTNDNKTSKTHELRKDFTAVMKEKKIYVLATGYLKQASSSPQGSLDDTWDLLMFVGTIKDKTGSDGTGASITWEEGKSLKSELANDLSQAEVTRFFGGVGNGVVTKSGTIVFPVYMYTGNHQSVSSILYSTDDGSKWQIGKMTEDSTYDGSVVELGDDKLLYIVSSSRGYRKVFESDNMGSTWSESLMLSGVWGNQPGRSEYGSQGTAIKVPVDGKDVLLFAHPLSEGSGSSTDTLQLWLSDGKRIVRIGTISDKEKEANTGNSILAHVGDQLYITHEINPNGVWSAPDKVKQWSGVIGLSPLPEFFASAKTTVRAWRNLDKWFLSKGISTQGIVGFLGTAKDNDMWTDIYKCVNATVNDGEPVDGGFKFNGNPGSGAQWPVESQGQNQVYIFAEKQFTLAATVTIHTGSENGQFSLIGASLDSQGSNVLLGLGYTHENKWYAVSNGKTETTTEETFERENEYHVALTFANGKASVYVDGKEITSNKLDLHKTAPIRHFYMGGIGDSSTAKGSSCTVKNVMLFNMALEINEIAKLTAVSKKGKLGEPAFAELPTVIPEGDISVPKTKSTTMLKSSKYVATTEPNTASVSSRQTVTTRKADDKNMNKFQHEINKVVSQKDTNRDNGAMVSFSAAGLVCLVCSFIVLIGL